MTDRTCCCIVGGGPAGVILSLLLARRGVSTSLLEANADFDRIMSSLPLLRTLPARLIGWGIRPERVRLTAVSSCPQNAAP